ncbi:ABC transporter substrate-binding protein [Niabella beijingensis]|uniref:ABC transporter substrate-binding protein n=1 Tax=Niabella beijingensis TaxID=2872700 RepID=UPI001CBF2BB6|nr:ABC transporter substrate-binding protein [Niabella beijingensis]MBZ4188492.1 amino acid ABC transporter substrate-binding protein [Niabella beijingensis]
MKKLSLFILLAFCNALVVTAQVNPGQRHKMALFTPLYLDAAFGSDGSYNYNGRSFPKASIPGLEFYHGASMAIDSLDKLNIPLDIYIYDSRSAKQSLESQVNKAAADGVELIIANCAISELDKLSKLAASKKITLINAIVPNDGNVRDNPYFVVMNPTLPTQGEQIYAYLKKNYPNQQIVYLTRKGASENYLRSVFETLNKLDRTTAMHIKFTDVRDSLSPAQIAANFAKGRSSLFVIGSLDNSFSEKLLGQLSRLSKTYPQITVMGMPTWDNLNFSKYKGLNLVYSNPFYNSRTDMTSRNIVNYYNTKMYARPSDLVFRAYDLTYRFGRLISQYGKDNMAAALASKEHRVFYDYDIQAVSKTNKIDYYENKKLYFLEYSNGSLRAVK